MSRWRRWLPSAARRRVNDIIFRQREAPPGPAGPPHGLYVLLLRPGRRMASCSQTRFQHPTTSPAPNIAALCHSSPRQPLPHPATTATTTPPTHTPATAPPVCPSHGSRSCCRCRLALTLPRLSPSAIPPPTPLAAPPPLVVGGAVIGGGEQLALWLFLSVSNVVS